MMCPFSNGRIFAVRALRGFALPRPSRAKSSTFLLRLYTNSGVPYVSSRIVETYIEYSIQYLDYRAARGD